MRRGSSSIRTSSAPTPASSHGASYARLDATRATASSARRSTRSRPRTRSSTRPTVAGDPRACGLARRRRAGAPVFTRRRHAGPRGRHGEVVSRDRRRPTTPLVVQVSRWDRAEGPDRRHRGVRRATSAGRPTRTSSWPGPNVDGVADDPEGARGPRRGACVAGETPASVRGARPPRLAADGRHRGERRDRQRAPAPRDGGRAEEPRRGLRAHRRRGDVEGAAGGRERRRRESKDQIEDGETVCCSTTLTTARRTARRCTACLRHGPGECAWEAGRVSAFASTSSAITR